MPSGEFVNASAREPGRTICPESAASPAYERQVLSCRVLTPLCDRAYDRSGESRDSGVETSLPCPALT